MLLANALPFPGRVPALAAGSSAVLSLTMGPLASSRCPMQPDTDHLVSIPTLHRASEELIGGKARSLQRMAQAGMTVPPAFVLSTRFFQPWYDTVFTLDSWQALPDAHPDTWPGLCDTSKAVAIALPLSDGQRATLSALGVRLAAARAAAPHSHTDRPVRRRPRHPQTLQPALPARGAPAFAVGGPGAGRRRPPGPAAACVRPGGFGPWRWRWRARPARQARAACRLPGVAHHAGAQFPGSHRLAGAHSRSTATLGWYVS